MADKYGFNHEPDNYSFAIGGRYILVAPVETPLPTLVVPLTGATPPSGWTNLGACENGEVAVSITQQTEDINTGVVPTARRTIISGQGGSVETNLQFYEPGNFTKATGVAASVDTASTSLNRARRDLYFGGRLGDIVSLLIPEDFDINLVENASGGRSYEQVWFYTPKAQKDGDIDLGKKIGKAPAINFKYKLLGYTFNSLTILMQMTWLQV